MAVFRYEAVNASGRIIAGTRTAELLSQVEDWLTANSLSPIRIEIALGDSGAADDPLPQQDVKLSVIDRFTGVSLEDLILFCRQIATMLLAGVPVLQGLQVLVAQVRNALLRQTIAAIAADVEAGARLSDSFAKHPRTFNQLFLNVIRIGEESGNLDNSFSYLADLFENEKDVQERIKSATRYPKIVIVAIFSAVAFLMIFVVPKFIDLFARSRVELPLPTKILILVSGVFSKHYLIMLVFIIITVMAYRTAMQSTQFVLFRDRLILRLPVIGELTIKIFMSRFCRVFAVLTESGIDIIRTLELSSSALENLVMFRMAGKTLDDVRQGVSLHESMSKHPLFPPMVVQMVTIGEESGSLDTMMAKVADYYDQETNYTIKNMATLIEPFLLLFLGFMVGFIALAIFTPMWNMMQVMRG